MANRSTFPNTIDVFIEHYDISPSDAANVSRYKTLKEKTNRTSSENTELNNLTNTLRNKLFSPEDLNKLQDCITNLETFFTTNVQDFISDKQTEINTYANTKMNDTTTFVNTKKTEMETSKTNAINAMEVSKTDAVTTMEASKTSALNSINTTSTNAITAMETSKTDGISQMENKKNYFVTYVDTKENEVRELVNEFDSNSARYYQMWTATTGQTDFNIYSTSAANQNIPPEANLNISEENIDLVINGVLMTPYVDFLILNNGLFNTIRLTASASPLIQSGTEVMAKWFKNVGKLYFKHASSHGHGGTDALTITENMLDSTTSAKLNMVNKKITISTVSPTSPAFQEVWIDMN